MHNPRAGQTSSTGNCATRLQFSGCTSDNSAGQNIELSSSAGQKKTAGQFLSNVSSEISAGQNFTAGQSNPSSACATNVSSAGQRSTADQLNKL